MERNPGKTDNPASGQLHFFREWLKNPLSVAAVAPSSPQLARQMMAQLPRNTQRVIELGGGTGVFTRALLEHGIAPENLLVLELNEELHRLLSQQFPDVAVALADARDLGKVVEERASHFLQPQVDAVVSGLGLLSMSRATQTEILQSAFDCLRPDGRFIQFTYGPANPVAREVIESMGLLAQRASFTWWNVPPATVYVYTRSPTEVVRPISMR